MYKIKVPLGNLRINNAKINKAKLNRVLDNLVLESYDYIDHVNVLYKTIKIEGIPITTKSLEFFCTTKIAQKSVKKIIKKLQNNGLHNTAKKRTKVMFIDIETNQTDFGVDFASLRPIKIPERVNRKNRSTYLTMHMYSNHKSYS
tara:strand:+ start:16 stop:450 length:435 start_codon:yes stop_codon:yes gene_type:complete